MPTHDPHPRSHSLSRRNFLAGAAAGAAVVALPAWPAVAAGTAGAGGAVLEDHPATEPSGTHVRSISGVNTLFAYGAVVPSFDGWRTAEPKRDYLRLDGTWRFAFDPDGTGLSRGWHSPDFDDRSWQSQAVPSAWDLYGTPGFGSLDGTDFGTGTAFQDGYAWYRKTVVLTGTWRTRHIRLNSLGAGYSAEIWFDGTLLGKHEGASQAFSMPLPESRRADGRHTIAVRVFRRASYLDYANGNTPVTDDREVPYKPVDYWPYGGLYRSLWLEGVARTSISKILVASAGDRLTARIVLENNSDSAFTGEVSFDPGAGAGRVKNKPVSIPPRSASVVGFTIDMRGVARWTPQHPALLSARATLSAGGKAKDVYDSLSTRYGLRDIAVTGEQLQLDGGQLFLKGLNWHEETAHSGRALTVPEYDRELAQVLTLGANFIRNSVYNRHPYVYEWADSHGVLVMDDLDTMWLNTAQEKLQTEQYGLSKAMALTMAWNQHNHPSVILWCLQNESEIDGGGAPVYRAWLTQLKEAVKTVDLSQRPVTWASSTTNDPAFDIADVIGFNEYFGYFYGASSDLGPAIDAVHAAHPGKPLLITENGAWAIAGTHGLATEQGTEEWQAQYLADHWAQVVARRSYVSGYTAWVLKDYKERAGYNQAYNGISVMGLVTFDSLTPKLAYDTFRGLSA
ncbi:glycoside hydrolase family 2 TIM barrel-domain containing protein [Leifsonia sp. C5G2]|uniref:glycoside hydrolase family 2 protein n=1 Tax=Leifsonia sp. C5G2 TaxID=2735269 RepID=UPI0015844DAD|nr:glycoside hydrolase family 2 TIM barrel-domain containing protein [Leifsonia sp. C5G2]NUU06167.1 twin-arginine translocation signal domain-containing protein [Leifsonia sp. C5G2]